MDNRPIGVFDSGLGGLTAVKELEKVLPEESIVYFGDTGRVPYGNRSRETILRYARQDMAFLLDHGVKAILAACGTVSSVARSVGEGLDVPYFDVIGPTVKAAAQATKNGRIGVIGTAATIASGSYALPLNIQGLHDDLMRYRVEYDNWFKESTLHENGSVDRVVALLKEKGATSEKDGALWFKGGEYGSEDFVVVRSNGVPTYVVPDIAYHYNKLVTRNFDMAIDVLGADHHGYVPRLKAALTALGVDASRLNVVLMQMVRLVRDGEIVKASKRSGKAITLVTLLDEVPVDAARFLFNSYEPNTRIDFDLDLAIQQDAQNPVYYVQYAHARICSILKNLKADGIEPRECTPEELKLLSTPEEVELIRHLSSYTDELISAAKSFDPARIPKYAVSLATLFHKFYNACRVKGVDEPLQAARLYLCLAARTVICNALSLFKVNVPDSM